MELTTDFFERTAKVLTVAELTRAIRGMLETRFGAVWVQGEISNYKQHPSGHQYFTLKDSRAQIACVIFRNAPLSIRQPLADGAQVQVYGNVSVFEARGQYQLSVEIVQPRGLGLLQAKFEALKRKLEAEGLFDPARKKLMPKFPKRIGIVTSPSGAAIRDTLNILRQRPRGIEILINPVRVQGMGAAAEIALAINELSNPSTIWPPIDLIVIVPGGGSIEDLWEFNEEIVARADRSRAGSDCFRGGTRNRFHHRRFRGGFACTHAKRGGGIDCASRDRARPARERAGLPVCSVAGETSSCVSKRDCACFPTGLFRVKIGLK